ncbi:MAG: DNA replication/repair protein RecF [Clostridiales bacterium]|nr:DNA replication/repair protein RecF [Clostridiales bacterium]
MGFQRVNDPLAGFLRAVPLGGVSGAAPLKKGTCTLKITGVQLNNYRSYETCEIEPCEGVNVLLGNNGQGKTNVLEALYLTCTGRSHRTRQDRELIRWGADFATVNVQAMRRDGSHEVEFILPAMGRRKIKIAGQEISRSGELMGHVTGVLFSPEDLRTVKDGPAERRRFVDMALSQLRPAYYYALQRYARALKQRNEVLKAALASPSLMATIDSWDEQLASAGAELMRHRRAYIERLSAVAAETHLHIADGREKLEIRYLPSIDRGDTVEAALEALFAARETDTRRLTTSVGAHRDDVQILVEGRDVRAYGSQGQQRTAALSMRLSELTVMHDELGEWPMLMLDDVMSELDPGRRRQLVSRLSGIQTFITCTDEEDLAGASIGRAWRVENGSIHPL